MESSRDIRKYYELMKDLINFVSHNINRVHFNPHFNKSKNYKKFIEEAFEITYSDCKYYYPNISRKEVLNRIIYNKNELPVFLYRLQKIIFNYNTNSFHLYEIQSIMKEICGCEIYYSINIGEGFRIHHGLGSVIGSRCNIGKGFTIHHGCTVGHKKTKGNGPTIGDNVELGAFSQILGEIEIGNNVKIGSHSLVINNLSSNCTYVGVPAKKISE